MSRDPWGYPYPGSWFLRTQIGFDIVGLGEDGLVIPDRSKWQMPAKIDIKEIPSFNTRRWTMNRVISKEIQRMAMGESGRNISWHALGRVIDPAKYGKTHPEYFPLVKGKRYTKPPKQLCDWSPCLGNPDVQRVCAEHLLKRSPYAAGDGASLAVNDGGGHICECDLCKALDEPGGVTKSNYSNRFFRFYEKVLDLARQKEPNVKTIILLYHDSTSKVPSHAKIHPGIIGMGTNNVDFEGFAKKGLKQFGLWDHHLDYRHPLPPHYPKRLAKKLRRLHDIGMREYFGEVYMIHAANGPKQYVLGRLLWNLDTDVDQAMMEYCTKAFGPAAAPFVKQYYDVWEQVDSRRKERMQQRKLSNESYNIGSFVGLDQGDTARMEALLKKAAAAEKTGIQKRRLQVVINYFDYIRCLADRYLISERLREDKKLSLAEIHKLSGQAAELDKKFKQMWNDVISKDELGNYRYIHVRTRPDAKPRVDRIYYNFGDVVRAYVYDSVEAALKNLEDRECKNMKRRDRIKFWEARKKEFPDMFQISLRLNQLIGKPVPNLLKNGNFKKYRPGDPAVPGAHPQLENWYFYEQVGSVQTDEYKSLWKIVPSKAAYNHLGIGTGKYPEIRTYVKLTAGTYRFAASCLTRMPMNFAFYQIPEFDSDSLNDVARLRKQRFRTPEIFGFTCHAAPGVLPIRQTFTIPADGWYALLIAIPNQPPRAWSRLWGVKLEKLP